MRGVTLAVCVVWAATFVGCEGTVTREPQASKAVKAHPATATEAPAAATSNAPTGAKAASRKFVFNYRFRVTGLTPSEDAEKNVVRVWLPCPPDTECQTIVRHEAAAPGKLSESKESRYGNRILYFQTTVPESGEFTVDVPYEVVRHEALPDEMSSGDDRAQPLDGDTRARFLAADRLVPISGKPLNLLKTVELPTDKLSLARRLYDIVDEQVTYKKEGQGWGRGDTNWVCDSGYGNCTDFHSLFISLARSQGLPARFEIGFSIPSDKTEGRIAGYHCWAWFHADESGWVPVDISEADKFPKLKDYYFGHLTADRVLFSVGRDLKLVPPAASAPLNFFIYPHIEVGGEALAAENVEQQFAFMDEQ